MARTFKCPHNRFATEPSRLPNLLIVQILFTQQLRLLI